MSIEKARNGDVELAYEREGPVDGMPLLLLNGAGAQMVMWPSWLCAALLERGFQIVRMDTRDTGLSTNLTKYDVPRRVRPPRYTLRDMADDVVAVLDALGWPAVHLFGASQGGAIAQVVATHHPARVRSLTSAFSTPTTSLLVVRPKLLPNLKAAMAMNRTSRTRDEEGEKWARVFRAVGSPGYPAADEQWREFGRLSFDRGLNPRGSLRLGVALMRSGDRRQELSRVKCPTLIIHGEDDPMCSVRGGRATAAAIPGARLLTFPGMGHDIPQALWPVVADEMAALAGRAEQGADGADGAVSRDRAPGTA